MRSVPLLMCCALLFVAPAQGPLDNCAGCVGAGGSASSSGGTCGGMVSISVVVESGECHWMPGDDELLFECLQKKGCKTTVTRSWDLPTETKVDACVVLNDDKLCLKPRTPGASLGNGEPRDGPILPCSDDAGDGLTFSVEAPECGLAAEVHATCTACQGDS